MGNAVLKNCMSAGHQYNEHNFQLCNGKTGADYLAWVSDFVSRHRHVSLTLKNPAGATLRIGGLEDTIYRDAHAMVNGWGKFYLPVPVHMQVIGVVEGTSYPCDQLVLMTCEDKKVYAYDGEELHLVAPSTTQLETDKKMEYPASKSYYKGEACKHMTEEDWDKVWMGPVGRRLDQEHHERAIVNKDIFLENLRKIRQITA